MGRLITFAAGILLGVVLKWQYDQQQLAPTPATSPQPTGRNAAPSRSAGDVQDIAITVADHHRPAATPTPALSAENPATPPDAE